MKASKIALIMGIMILIGLFFAFDLSQYLDIDYLKSQRRQIENGYQSNPTALIGGYFIVYVLVTGLSLPGATVLTLAGGAIFGLAMGVIIVSFASTIGATLAFLVSRFLLYDMIQKRLSGKLKTINQGIKKEGAFYLFALRLVPVFPFFLVNLLMGLMPIRIWTFYWVSQVGMLAGTIAYVFAGTQFSQIESLDNLLSPRLLFALALLGLFPLVTRKVLDVIKAKRVYGDWVKPKNFDTNLVIIGAGAAGLVSAYIAAVTKAKVTLIEKHKMGGDCLNTGCVPSKALIRSAKLLSQTKRAAEFGIKQINVAFDFADIMDRVRQTIKQIQPHDSVERYTRLGVDCIQGHATITSPWTVEVNNKVIRTRSVIIAAGAEPFVPEIKGLENTTYYTSDTIWELSELPGRLLIMGGGPMGCELAQSFQRLGSQVIQLQRGARLMSGEDSDVADLMTREFTKEGIDVRVGHTPLLFQNNTLFCQYGNDEVRIKFDALLLAVGRCAQTNGYGLDNLGIDLNDKCRIDTNEFLQTKYPNIYACGDVVGPYQFTHIAAHQAWYASVNALLGFKKFKVDYAVIPRCTFTDPEVARVGLNEQEARQQDIAYELTTCSLNNLDRAIIDGQSSGFVKILTIPGQDRILGVTIVAEHAGDLISEFTLAMRHGLGLKKILDTIHIYPTHTEANKYTAGNWKKAHKPKGLLKWMEKFHRWRRRG